MMPKAALNMRSYLAILLLVAAAFGIAACSGNSGAPDGNAVQVGNGDYGSVPIADIPTDFVSATDALGAGNRLLDAGETERAIDAFLQAVKMDPDLAEAYFKLGIAYSLVEKDLDLQTGDAVTTENTGKGTEKKKNSEKAFESAVTAYKKLIEANKEDHVAHFYLGLTYNKLNKDDDAARELREAVKLKPDNTEYQTELGSILIKLAKYYEAVAALKKAIELDPTNMDAQDLLEQAEAGRKRIDFVPPREKPVGNSNTNANANSEIPANVKTEVPNTANSNTKSVPKITKTPPVPSRSPK